MLLVRLGLRAGEVSALRLDESIGGPGRSSFAERDAPSERLPLPPDVGQLSSATCGRTGPPPRAGGVHLRLRAVAGADPGGVGEVARAAGERAGLPSFGAHRLRHTAATQMLRAGAGFPRCAGLAPPQRGDDGIYAKVDHPALASWSRPGREVAMTHFRRAVTDYLAIRRAMGYKLARQAGCSTTSSATWTSPAPGT